MGSKGRKAKADRHVGYRQVNGQKGMRAVLPTVC